MKINRKQAEGLGTQLRRLLELMDEDLAQIYAEEIPGYVPRYTPVMKALAKGGARTIKEIAAMSSISHSAASQTVSLMVKAGYVRLRVGTDARERRVSLTRKARDLLPRLEARWAATDEAALSLEREIGVPLNEIFSAAIEALERQSFRERIRSARRARRPD